MRLPLSAPAPLMSQRLRARVKALYQRLGGDPEDPQGFAGDLTHILGTPVMGLETLDAEQLEACAAVLERHLAEGE